MPATIADGPALLPETRELAAGKNFASVTTVLPSGLLQAQTSWVHVDGERLAINMEVHRRKYPDSNIKSERVIISIAPERQTFIDQSKGVAAS